MTKSSKKHLPLLAVLSLLASLLLAACGATATPAAALNSGSPTATTTSIEMSR